MAVEVAADRPSLLVLSEMYHQGWRAAVNGTPSLIQRVDGGLRGIVVPRVAEVGSNSHTLRSAVTRAVRWVSSHWELCSRRRCCLEAAFRGNGALRQVEAARYSEIDPNSLKA
jgi:hypothetical protein